MNRNTILVFVAAAACLCSCAKSASSGLNDGNKRYFDAWVHVQKKAHPEYAWTQTTLGSYILQDTPGKGDIVGEFDDSLYVRVHYTYYDLDGNITGSTSEVLNKQLGAYSEQYYYGPTIWYAEGTYAGVEEIVKDMKPGGFRKVAIPGWLNTTSRYDTAADYLAKAEGDDAIYDIKLVESFHNVNDWEIDSIGRYLVKDWSKYYGKDVNKAKADSAGYHGFYYVTTSPAKDTATLKDTTIYINYIGRFLDGKVFDTNIRDTAMRYGLYSSGSTYEPSSISLSENWSDITMGSDASTVINGFALTISKMKAYEKGTGIFYSELGYSYSGSGSKIPPYCPLRFDIEIVDSTDD